MNSEQLFSQLVETSHQAESFIELCSPPLVAGDPLTTGLELVGEADPIATVEEMFDSVKPGETCRRLVKAYLTACLKLIESRERIRLEEDPRVSLSTLLWLTCQPRCLSRAVTLR